MKIIVVNWKTAKTQKSSVRRSSQSGAVPLELDTKDYSSIESKLQQGEVAGLRDGLHLRRKARSDGDGF